MNRNLVLAHLLSTTRAIIDSPCAMQRGEMSSELKKEIQLEIGHALFIGVVDYSKLLINEQRALLE
jgi:hypothetical protein